MLNMEQPDAFNRVGSALSLLGPSGAASLGAEIRVPTLIVVGDGDVPDILACSTVLEEGIAGARKVVLPGTAHMLNMEQPDAFNRVVLDFLRAP
jgi:pimeloyl-ACP methyl ester carboxylesterase